MSKNRLAYFTTRYENMSSTKETLSGDPTSLMNLLFDYYKNDNNKNTFVNYVFKEVCNTKNLHNIVNKTTLFYLYYQYNKNKELSLYKSLLEKLSNDNNKKKT